MEVSVRSILYGTLDVVRPSLAPYRAQAIGELPAGTAVEALSWTPNRFNRNNCVDNGIVARHGDGYSVLQYRTWNNQWRERKFPSTHPARPCINTAKNSTCA